MSELTSLKKEIELHRERLDILISSKDIDGFRYDETIYKFSIELDLLIEEYINMVEKEKIANTQQCI